MRQFVNAKKRYVHKTITQIFRWLGGSDAELEDDWRWVGSGNAFDYTNWARDGENTTET